jgi:hypothetical protein
MLKKEIANGSFKFATTDVVAKVSDGGVVVPATLQGTDRDLMYKWFQQVAGRIPTADEIESMGNAWGVLTHIPIGSN